MKKKVVIENVLHDVKNYFTKEGYDVTNMYFDDNINDINTNEYDAIIVRDRNNSNLPQDVKNDKKVIEAMGLVPHQVFEKFNNRLK